MTTIQSLFQNYSEDHQNPTNQKIHYVCVPLIVYSLLGILWTLPALAIGDYQFNWAIIIAGLSLCYYFVLSLKHAVLLLPLLSLFFLSFFFMNNYDWPVLGISVAIFIIAWIGQFYGHKIEGKKPSFLTDLVYLMVGPLWVIDKVFKLNTTQQGSAQPQ